MAYLRNTALALSLALAAPTTGCRLIEELGPYLAPTAAQVVLLEVPLESLGDEFGAQLPQSGVNLTVTLLRVGQSGTAFSEDDLLSGAQVTLHHAMFDGVALEIPERPDARGVYSLSSADVPEGAPPLLYYPGTNYTIQIEHNGEHYELYENVPDRTSLLAPRFEDYIGAGESVRMSWEPETERHSFIGVFNSKGEYVYSNLPGDASGFYDFITQPPASAYTLPSDVFTADDIYVMSAAAMRLADWDADDGLSYISDNLNPLGTIFLAGSAAVTAVTTVPLEYVSMSMVGVDGAGGPRGFDTAASLEVFAYGLDLESWFDGDADVEPILDPMWLTVPGGTEFPLVRDPRVSGRYALDPDDAEVLQYLPGEVYKITIEEEDRQITRWLSAEAAPGVSFYPPEEGFAYHEVADGQPWDCRWAQWVDAVSLQVFDYDGQLVYTGELGAARGDDEEEVEDEGPFDRFRIPEEAFSSGPGLYSVGVLGMMRAARFEGDYGLNTDISQFVSGMTVFTAVNVLPQEPEAP